MKFTKEEISLCEQIAEKHIKKVKYGEWYLLNGKPILCAYANEGFHKSLEAENKIVPLWTISDCLEFLRKKCQDHVLLIHDKEDDVEWFLWMDEYKETQQMGKGKTPLEACLKAVLAVLEEGK